MKKILVIVAGVGVFVFAVGASSFIWNQRQLPSPTTTKQMISNGNIQPAQKTVSRYLAFSPDEMKRAEGTRRILFFFANWCPTCRPADKDFSENAAQLPSDVTLIRVNYNDNETDQAEKDLARRYGVTYQHTFVQIDAAGNEVTKWNGGQTAELLRNLQ